MKSSQPRQCITENQRGLLLPLIKSMSDEEQKVARQKVTKAAD